MTIDRIRAIFNSTDEAELAAIRLSEAGIPLLRRDTGRVYVLGAPPPEAASPELGSYPTIFNMVEPDGEPRRRRDTGGSVALTIALEHHNVPAAMQVLRCAHGRELMCISGRFRA